MKSTASVMLSACAALLLASPAGAELQLNEIMPINHLTIADEAGEFDDWFEIYNSGDAPVALGDYWATDDPADTTGWAFPDTLLDPGGFLLVWADNDPEQGSLHATFKLSGSGEALLLYRNASLVDSTSFQAAAADTSFARFPDGSGPWEWTALPTPGAANTPTGINNPLPPLMPPAAVLKLLPATPNPFNPRTLVPLTLASDVRDLQVSIHDLGGRRISVLYQGPASMGQLQLAWNAQGLASGIYIIRAATESTVQTRRVVLLK